MARPIGITKAAFLQKAKEVHGDSYDYSEVEIDPTLRVLEHPPVKMRCKAHNYVFYEKPSTHTTIKRYSYRKAVLRRPPCCKYNKGQSIIFLHGGYSLFLDKIEELGKTMSRPQIALKLGYLKHENEVFDKSTRSILHKNIKKSEQNTGRKIKINHASSWASKYEGRNGWVKTQWGLSLFENGTEKKRECKSCHLIFKLDQFHMKSATEPIPRRECKKCWKENKIIPWRRDHPHYRSERMKIDPVFKLSSTLRTSVSNAIRTCKKNGVDVVKKDKTLNLLGAQSWRAVFNHFEALFTSGMTWQNHGRGDAGKKEWHIDHIIPIDYFIKNKDFTLLEVQKECFNISNLQPLWAAENLSKSNRIFEKDIH
jgi:hypothetical protein